MDIFLILFILSLFGIGIFARKIFELSKRVTQFETVEEQQVNLEDEEYPFNQTLKELYKQIEDIQSSYGEYQTTKEGINTKLDDLNLVTSRLNRTLASNQKRGDWGEIQVEKILEDAGMVKGQHFEAQKELKSGKIPDITFKLPDEKILNLDVKFPLENYMNYLDVIEKKNNSVETAEIEMLDQRSKDLKNTFLEDVRKRVSEVLRDGYIDPSSNTLDYALMFVPVEGVFQFIVENELELSQKSIDVHREALEKKVILVPPTLLLVFYSTIRNAVDTFNLQNKAQDLIELHKKFIKQWNDYQKKTSEVGNSIEGLQKKYSELIGVRTNELNKVVEKMDQLKIDSEDSLNE